MNKQIEEMARDLQETHDYEGCEAWNCRGCQYEEYGKNYFCSSIKQSEKMIAKGYRKQSEGEWESIADDDEELIFRCSCCNEEYSCELDMRLFTKYCPNRGAKMKGCKK